MSTSRRAVPGRPKRVLLHTLRPYMLRPKIILAGINLAVSTLTAKPYNSLSKFPAIQSIYFCGGRC